MTPLPAADDPSEPRHLPERIRVSPDVLFQEIEGEGVLMNIATEQYFSLDPMGTTIWNLLSANRSTQETRAQLLEFYEVSPEALEKDLTEFITRLIDAGLIVPES